PNARAGSFMKTLEVEDACLAEQEFSGGAATGLPRFAEACDNRRLIMPTRGSALQEPNKRGQISAARGRAGRGRTPALPATGMDILDRPATDHPTNGASCDGGNPATGYGAMAAGGGGAC
uniref:hypothetical protein n=1 Tax=Mangrovicoccus sp. HB161399 TaxID=2720392 RepID=UPI001C130927